MKHLFTLLFLSAITLGVLAQVPNASFESWTGGEPDAWVTNNSQVAGTVTKSTTAHSGSSAVQLNVVSFGPNIYNTLGGKITIGDTSNNYAGYPDTLIPTTLTGWYTLNPLGGDFLTINSSAKQAGLLVAFGIAPQIGDTTSIYKQFTITYDKNVNVLCDTISLSFQINNTNGTPVHVGTIATIDDLNYTYTGIEEIKNTASLEPCSPNPASNTANIIYSVVGYSTVSLDLYDLAGQKVKSILDNAHQGEGRYKIPTDVSSLPNGMYFYRLTVNGQTLTQKLVVAK